MVRSYHGSRNFFRATVTSVIRGHNDPRAKPVANIFPSRDDNVRDCCRFEKRLENCPPEKNPEKYDPVEFA